MVLRFLYSDGGLYRTYRVLRFMYSYRGLYKGWFTLSNFGLIIISSLSVYDEKCWHSYNPIFPSNYFVMYSRETRQFLF